MTDETTTLYRFFDADDGLLYVGITHERGSRMRSHRHHSRWWDNAVRVTFSRYPTRKEAAAAEAQAIREEHPVWNIIYNRPPKHRLGHPVPPPARIFASTEARVAEINRMIAAGYRDADVARCCGVSRKTIGSHHKRITARKRRPLQLAWKRLVVALDHLGWPESIAA